MSCSSSTDSSVGISSCACSSPSSSPAFSGMFTSVFWICITSLVPSSWWVVSTLWNAVVANTVPSKLRLSGSFSGSSAPSCDSSASSSTSSPGTSSEGADSSNFTSSDGWTISSSRLDSTLWNAVVANTAPSKLKVLDSVSSSSLLSACSSSCTSPPLSVSFISTVSSAATTVLSCVSTSW